MWLVVQRVRQEVSMFIWIVISLIGLVLFYRTLIMFKE
ncbi:hypothetical protein K13PH07C1L_LOCUS13 [Klebsiella phage vB_Kpn_K13PH07C1L]|uniref:Uncharacterized protein n=1 Tax=Klebsiella phage vB_Kpn_K13PH07C1L TaxID=3071649 RepID=A0AAV1MEW4_9CAUD|nr:hypothetical protein K13PH07C1L_LOCUS13 [Klebsiella phage vB_Kpn_K13PH07C1L]CAK6604086.1 hypothetical protein K13PH07C1S_LOCUS12 [Klebsiella phage vB_Kpn_K13PH07C1S]